MARLVRKPQEILADEFARGVYAPSDLLVLLRRLGERSAFLDFLGKLCVGSAAESVAARSYVHVNGFDKLVLISPNILPIPYELRLHVWPGRGEGKSSHVHNHSWDFASIVLSGQITTFDFVVGSSGELFKHFSYTRESQDTYAVGVGEMALLALQSGRTLSAGDSYFQSHAVLHRAWSDAESGAVTLVLQGCWNCDSSDVFVPVNQEASNSWKVAPMELDTYRWKLQRIVSLLSQQPAEALEP